MMKRPGIVWLFTIFSVGDILGSIIFLFLVNPSIISDLAPIYYTVIFSSILIIIRAIFVYLFFMLKKDSLTWLYISFGLSIIMYLIIIEWMYVGITAIWMWVVWDYISHKKIDGKPLFT